jgi:ubiquitin C-terminal hydrolase
MKGGEFWFPANAQGIEDLLSTTAPSRRDVPPPAAVRSASNSVGFRWVLENWKLGAMKQFSFHFPTGDKYLIKNQQPLESTHLEFLFRPQDSITREEIWYVEIVVQHAFDFQKASVLYSPLVITPNSTDAKLITSISVSEIDSYLFAPSTLYIDVRIADEPFGSAGSPALPGSSVVSLMRPIPYSGLLNLGSSGYMNSVLQTLFHIPRFREAVYGLPQATRTIRELQRLFGALHVAAKVCSTRLLTQTLQWGETESFPGRPASVQRDAQSFFRLLLNHIRDNTGDPAIATLFTGKLATAIRTLHIDLATSHVGEFYDIALEVRGCSSLAESLSKFVEPQLLTVGDPYFRQDQSMGIEFLELPPVLVFNLRRSIFNNMTGKREENSDFFSFPEDLDLTRFVPHSPHALTYDLFSVLVHTGNTISGHHFAFIKAGPGDQWYHFNDSVVSLASREQAVTQNFGGNMATAAYMLVYTRKALAGELFRPCELPPKVRDFVSDVQLRAPGGRTQPLRLVRKFTLITEDAVRRQVLDDARIQDITEFAGVVELDEGSSNHDLYSQVAVYCDRQPSLILLWKVDDRRMPTVVIPQGPQKCPQKDMVIFVQELFEPVINLQKGMRVAILTYFCQSATPRVQMIGSTQYTPAQPILQLFPIVWSILGIPNILFNVYCEDYDMTKPIPQNYALGDLGLTNGAVFLLEPVVPVQSRYQFAYYTPPPEETVSYYSKLRPNGDMSVAEYLERHGPQVAIEIFRVADVEAPVVRITAPELMQVTELPGLLLFATREQFDPKRDTLQIFRQKLNEPINEPIPYVMKPDVNIRMMFVSELKRGKETPRLYYDILKGVSPEQLKSMIVRTCEIYDAPCHRLKQIRYPMKAGDPLQTLLQYIQTEVYSCKSARLLMDIEGLVQPVDFAHGVDGDAILRFDVVPADQRVLKPGEFLVVALVCRYTKNQDSAPSLGQSFLFKVVPGEVVETTKMRIGGYEFADSRLMPAVVFQVGGRILNGDERLDAFLKPNDLVRVVLPSTARSRGLLRSK